MFWPGIAAMVVLYIAVFAVGIVASRRRSSGSGGVQEIMLAGRSLPLWVGLLTMTATWVGGGYINGTAESTWSSGLLWGAQAGVGYALSLVLGGVFFAGTMRRRGYATLVDPLEERYGKGAAALLMVPAVLAELFWSAAILVALGTAFGTVVGLDLRVSIGLSAAVAVAYTVTGGLRSVAWTDVVQLGLIVAGLGLALPWALAGAGGLPGLGAALAEASGGFGSTAEALSWGDWTLILILGGIPWNVYFQRVLASRDARSASIQSILAGGLCLLLAVPPVLLGLAARGLDWAALGATEAGMALGGPEVITATLAETPALVLPYLLRLAVPTWVSVLGLGAVAAAVMSSVDSSILSASSLVAHNGFKRLITPGASARQVEWLLRGGVVVLGTAAAGIAFSVQSVAALWYLCGDVVYTVLFPQLALALFDRRANRTGALAGLGVSVLLRLSGGDPTLGLPAFLAWPTGDWDFPFRTIAMLAGLGTAVAVSRLTARRDPPRSLRPEQTGP